MAYERENITSTNGGASDRKRAARGITRFLTGPLVPWLILVLGAQGAVGLSWLDAAVDVFFTAAFILLLLILRISESLQSIAHGVQKFASTPASTDTRKDVSDI